MKPPRIYIETSVISYLTARSSRGLLVTARQSAIEHLGHAPPILATPEELLETLP